MTTKSVVDQQHKTGEQARYWFVTHSKSVIFLIITIALIGAYLAFTLPVSVFPETNFPRILIGVDNGVMPIDQMLVTVTSIWSIGITPLSTPIRMRGKFVSGKTETGSVNAR